MNEMTFLKKGQREKAYDLLFCLSVVVFSFFYYASSLTHGFYIDDPIWLYLGKQFLANGNFSSFPYYYRPLVTVSFAIQYLFFGTHYLYYHIFNVILFSLGTCLLFVLCKIIFRDRLVASLVAGLSVLNPLNFEKVNYIGMQSYLWQSVFYAVTFIGFVLYYKKSNIYYFLLYHAAFAGALWINETGTMLVPLLAILYLSLLQDSSSRFEWKKTLKYFLGVFLIFSLYAYIYAFRVYPKYLFFQQHGPIMSLEKLADLFDFLAIKLSYVLFSLPGGKSLFEIGPVSYLVVVIFLSLLVLASWRLKWVILLCILPVLPSYFSPNKFHWLASHIPVSSLGAWMLLGCGIKNYFSFIDRCSSKRLKSILCASGILCFVFMMISYVNLEKTMGMRHIRQSDKYLYYVDIVKKRWPEISGSLEVYFVDGSSLIHVNPEGDFRYKGRKGGDLDFSYLSFLYHLKLLYNNENIQGFAVSEKDVSALSRRKNSVILKID